MSHLAEAILRRSLDEPGALLSYEKEHLLACARCRATLERIRANAATVAAALASGGEPIDLDLAQRSTLARRPSPARPAKVRLRPSTTPAGRWGIAAAAAALFALAIAYTPLRGYAQSFLAIFEPHAFRPIGVTGGDLAQLRALPDLSAFGTMRSSAVAPELRLNDPTAAMRAARQTIGLPNWLPAGLPARPTYHVFAQRSVAFTFNAALARSSAAARGEAAPAMPPSIDGATVTATIGPAVAAVYGTARATQAHQRRRGLSPDMLVVSQAPAPRIYSNRVSLAQIEEYLLAQPGLPPDVIAQIRAIGDPASTLPIPIRIDRQSAHGVSVNGSPGIAIGDNTGVGSVVIWERRGFVHAVAGPFSEAQIVLVANSIAP